MIFLPIWLTGWTAGGIVAFVALVTGSAGGSSAFLAVWLVFWGSAWTMTALLLSWMMFGLERVTVSDRDLMVARELYGKRLARSFPLRDVRNIRAAGYFGNVRGGWNGIFVQMGMTGGTIAFDHSAGTERFGGQLEEPEANQVVQQLRARMPAAN